MKCKTHPDQELVCLACWAAAGGRIGGKSQSRAKLDAVGKNLSKAREARAKSSSWTIDNTIKILESDQKRTWTAAAIVGMVPEAKRKSARINVPTHLLRLWRSGMLLRVVPGHFSFNNG